MEEYRHELAAQDETLVPVAKVAVVFAHVLLLEDHELLVFVLDQSLVDPFLQNLDIHR